MRFNGKLLKGDGTIPMMREEWLVGQRIKKLCFFPINLIYTVYSSEPKRQNFPCPVEFVFQLGGKTIKIKHTNESDDIQCSEE